MTKNCMPITCSSQHFRETPLSCWIIIERDRYAVLIVIAWLDSERHFAAVLFYLEAAARIRKHVLSINVSKRMLNITDIDFTSAKGKKRKLDELIDCNSPNTLIEVQSLPLMKITSLFMSI